MPLRQFVNMYGCAYSWLTQRACAAWRLRYESFQVANQRVKVTLFQLLRQRIYVQYWQLLDRFLPARAEQGARRPKWAQQLTLASTPAALATLEGLSNPGAREVSQRLFCAT